MKKFTVIIRELKIIYHSSTTDQLDTKLLFYGMICHRHFNKLSHDQCLKII